MKDSEYFDEAGRLKPIGPHNTPKEYLAPGAWVDQDNALHFSLPDILEFLGVEDTEENRALLTEQIKKELGTEAEFKIRKSPSE